MGEIEDRGPLRLFVGGKHANLRSYMQGEAQAHTSPSVAVRWQRDLVAGLVVFLVALPLCLGIALASNAPMISGLIAGIVGGVVVGFLSGSQTSVSGPAAGLAAVVVAQLGELGSFSAFAVAVCLAGVIQLGLGFARAGFIAAFFPSSVIKGLLAAIGVLLILKQWPHVLGHDPDPVGEMEFVQPDGENTFSELIATFFDIHTGAAIIGIISVLVLLLWQRVPALKKTGLPAPLIVVGLGLGLSQLFRSMGPSMVIGKSHLVQMPVVSGLSGFAEVLPLPDFSILSNPQVYVAGLTIAVVASLETLLNLEAVDKLDVKRRHSPPNRELLAQGAGNVVSGLLGGLPVTSVIVRSSVNLNSNNETRVSCIFHGVLLIIAVILIPHLLNLIPLSCLAAILFITGFKLASPKLFMEMYKGGKNLFLPFIATVLAIVFIDLLIGVLIGLAVSAIFILYANYKRPLRKVMEHHVAEDVLRIQLANQVSFFSRASLEKALDEVPNGGHVLFDASETEYIDPDVLELITEFHDDVGPARNIGVSLTGFRNQYSDLMDGIQFVDFSSRDVQAQLSPAQVLEILRQGNQRFRKGQRIGRTLINQATATAERQAPLVAVLSGSDSRASVEHIFDLGIGEAFVVRVAGYVPSQSVLGSLEYGCAIAGAKLIVVLGHSACGAIETVADLLGDTRNVKETAGLASIGAILKEVEAGMERAGLRLTSADGGNKPEFIEALTRATVRHTVASLRERSPTLKQLIESGKVGIVGGIQDLKSGEVIFFDPELDGVKAVEAEARSTSSAPL